MFREYCLLFIFGFRSPFRTFIGINLYEFSGRPKFMAPLPGTWCASFIRFGGNSIGWQRLLNHSSLVQAAH
jgi:hypothetical protein